jgi:hypothetical protein
MIVDDKIPSLVKLDKKSEINRMLEVKERSQTIGEFLDWMKSQGWTFHNRGRHLDIEKLLAEYFNIDLQQVEKEKMMILDDIRSKQ